MNAAVTAVSDSVLDQVGVGSGGIRLLTLLSGEPLTKGGQPEVLFVCGEWSAFCAAERWPLIVAASRFGTLSGLTATNSSPSDVDPNTATLSFRNMSYSSSTIDFSPYEVQDGNRRTLGSIPPSDLHVFTALSNGSFPFLDIGGRYAVTEASFDPKILEGKNTVQVTNALEDPTSPIAQAVLGTANLLIAAICTTTGNQPASVCTASSVQAAMAKLPS